MNSTVSDDAPRPRQCHVRKWSDFNGYGFNLHAEKGKAGQFIGKVDPDSPADFAGLKEGDRIVEVNGTNIGNENHQQVVQRIKAVTDETKLLVLDREADDYYKEMKIVVRGDMPNVLVGVAPERNPASAGAVQENNVAVDSDLREDVDETPIHDEDVIANAIADETHPHKARFCHMKIWPDFQGYGFNLHAEKSKTGQYIGKVDANSPASTAGLRENDRIIEVNGFNVTQESHQTVVTKIKGVPNETKLLVLDVEADNYFKSRNIIVTESSSFVERNVTPDRKPEVQSSPAVVTSSSTVHPHKARFVQLCQWSNYNGYGFNMHSIKGKTGEFIGKVEDGSPAYVAGLKEGDRVVEVGGSNIENDTHADVVQKIKAAAGRASLLVVDSAADNYFREHGVAINASMSSLVRVSCPETKPEANGAPESFQSQVEESAYANGHMDHGIIYDEEPSIGQNEAATNDEVSSEADKIADSIMASVMEAERSLDEQNKETTPTEAEHEYHEEQRVDFQEDIRDPSPEPDLQNNNEEKDQNDPIINDIQPEYNSEPERIPTPEPVRIPTPEPQQVPDPIDHVDPEPTFNPERENINNYEASQAASPPTPTSPKSPVTIAGIEFAASAEEARKRMSGRKKEVRVASTTSLSAKQKYELFQKL